MFTWERKNLFDLLNLSCIVDFLREFSFALYFDKFETINIIKKIKIYALDEYSFRFLYSKNEKDGREVEDF